MAQRIKVGLCGFTMAMEEYGLHFSVVEIQHTFYEPPRDMVMRRWLAATPSHLEFTIKAWQLITHDSKSPTYRRLKQPLTMDERADCGGFRDTAIVRLALERTLACQKLLRATRILFQCPASFRPERENIARLRHFFTHIASGRPEGVRYMWEPRGPAWSKQAQLAAALCEELDLDYVVDPFVDAMPCASRPTVYLRLHGISGARHVYSDAELARLAQLTPDGAYVMFNNIPRVSDAKRFLLALGQKRPAFSGADVAK